jgi:15-cis-phytoene desaturase
MKTSVAVFGGGVAGLTAAHELICRGYDVTVYERRSVTGGKARTQYWKPAWSKDVLPGEHGFRFFPAFYHLIDDTLGRIPVDPSNGPVAPEAGLAPPLNGRSVLTENMISPKSQAWGEDGSPIVEFPRRPLREHPGDVAELVRFFFQGMRLPLLDLAKVWMRMLKFIRSCDRRRLEQYETQTFWEFMQADRLSERTQGLLRRVPRCLVAMDALHGNARTLNNVAFLLMIHGVGGNQPPDRILKGPTTAMWIDPWVRWLRTLGVRFLTGPRFALTSLALEDGQIASATLDGGDQVKADRYVVALPLEEAAKLVTDPLEAASPELAKLRRINLDASLSWMTGVQFYLKRDVPVVDGHVAYVESPWAATSVSQAQYWAPRDFKQRYGLGEVDGILSVDVSDWETAGRIHRKRADRCTRAEIEEELIEQIGAVLTDQGQPILTAANVRAIHIDEDIQFGANGVVSGNSSRLLIHPPGLWEQRPTPHDGNGIANLYLVGDYVRNDMDLATMEGANQSARDAVNAMLKADGSTTPLAISDPHLDRNEPDWVKEAKRYDDYIYPRGFEPLTGLLDADAFSLLLNAEDEESFWRAASQVERKASLLTTNFLENL